MRGKEFKEYMETVFLTKEQEEALNGLMLGDGYLETLSEGRTYKFGIEQSGNVPSHVAYINHLHELFKPFCFSGPQVKPKKNKLKSGEESFGLLLRTGIHPCFKEFASRFYEGKTKVVPSNIADYLTPRALAYWFMDDGALKDRRRQYGKRLHTEGFSFDEVELLCKALNEKGIKTTTQAQNRVTALGPRS